MPSACGRLHPVLAQLASGAPSLVSLAPLLFSNYFVSTVFLSFLAARGLADQGPRTWDQISKVSGASGVDLAAASN